MSTSVTAVATAAASARKCSFCAEEILAEAKKCRYCGEFVNRTLSLSVGAVFAVGVIIACILARTLEGVTAVGVWAIFALLFSRMFGRA